MTDRLIRITTRSLWWPSPASPPSSPTSALTSWVTTDGKTVITAQAILVCEDEAAALNFAVGHGLTASVSECVDVHCFLAIHRQASSISLYLRA
jgi:hypothetical protein